MRPKLLSHVEDQHTQTRGSTLKDLLDMGGVPEGWESDGALSRGAMAGAQRFSSPPSAQVHRCSQERALKLSSLTLAQPNIPLRTCSAQHTWHSDGWPLFIDRQRVALPTVPVETPDIT